MHEQLSETLTSANFSLAVNYERPSVLDLDLSIRVATDKQRAPGCRDPDRDNQRGIAGVVCAGNRKRLIAIALVIAHDGAACGYLAPSSMTTVPEPSAPPIFRSESSFSVELAAAL